VGGVGEKDFMASQKRWNEKRVGVTIKWELGEKA